MSLWEFSAAVSGWAKANSGEDAPKAPTAQEHDELLERFAHI